MMQQCPKCGSNEIIPNLRFQDHETEPVLVDIVEPEPPNRPFIWMAQSARSHFKADICGSCGYTELYAENFKALHEGHKKGYKSK